MSQYGDTSRKIEQLVKWAAADLRQLDLDAQETLNAWAAIVGHEGKADQYRADREAVRVELSGMPAERARMLDDDYRDIAKQLAPGYGFIPWERSRLGEKKLAVLKELVKGYNLPEGTLKRALEYGKHDRGIGATESPYAKQLERWEFLAVAMINALPQKLRQSAQVARDRREELAGEIKALDDLIASELVAIETLKAQIDKARADHGDALDAAIEHIKTPRVVPNRKPAQVRSAAVTTQITPEARRVAAVNNRPAPVADAAEVIPNTEAIEELQTTIVTVLLNRGLDPDKFTMTVTKSGDKVNVVGPNFPLYTLKSGAGAEKRLTGRLDSIGL